MKMSNQELENKIADLEKRLTAMERKVSPPELTVDEARAQAYALQEAWNIEQAKRREEAWIKLKIDLKNIVVEFQQTMKGLFIKLIRVFW